MLFRQLGLLMALTVSTVAWSCVGTPATDEFNSETLIAPGSATEPSTFAEKNFEMDVEPGTSNGRDGNGRINAKLYATGNPTSATTVEFEVIESGYPDQTAAVTYSENAGVTEIGYSNPGVLTGFETVIYNGGTTNGYHELRGVDLRNGTSLVCMEQWSGTQSVVCSTRSAAGAWTLTSTIFTPAVAFSTSRHPSPDIVRMPNGRLVVALLEQVGTSAYVSMFYSDNNGGSWNGLQRLTLEFDDASTVTYDDLRLTHDHLTDNFLIAVHRDAAGTHTSRLYVSANHGGSWTLVSTETDVRVHDLKTQCGVTVYGYVTGGSDLYIKRTAGGVGSLVTTSNGTVALSTTYMSMTFDQRNMLLIYGRRNGDNESSLLTSADFGRTLGGATESYPPDSGSTEDIGLELSTSLLNVNGVYFSDGQSIAVGNLTLDSGSTKYTGAALVYGGFSSIGQSKSFRQGTYYPTDIPEVKLATYTFVGSAAETITANAANDIVYELDAVAEDGYNTTGVGTIDVIKAFARVKLVSGGSTSNDELVISAAPCDGPNIYDVQLRFDADTAMVQMFDVAAAAPRGSAVAVSNAAPIDVLLAVSIAGKASAWWKLQTSLAWTAIAVNQTVTAAAGTDYHVTWGAIDAASTSKAEWYLFSHRTDSTEVDTEDLADGLDPEAQHGFVIPTSPARLPNGIFIFGKGGPFIAGETFEATTFSRQGFHRAIDINAFPSPRLNFQSATGSTGATSTANFDQGAAYLSRISDVLGMAILGGDVASATLRNYDGSSYDDLLSLNPVEQTPFGANPGFTRFSTSSLWIEPNGTNGPPRYFAENELAGLYLSFNDGADTVIAECLGNTDGQFSSATGVKQMKLRMAPVPVTGTWASLAPTVTAGVSSHLKIYWKDALVLGLQGDASLANRYYQIGWVRNSWATSETIGKIIPFRAGLVWRHDGTGAQHQDTSNDDVLSLPYGFNRGRQMAPAGRRERFSFSQQQLNTARYVGGQNIPAIGPGATARAIGDASIDHMVSLVRQYGRSTPFIWIKDVPIAADLSTPVTLYGKRQWMYGRLEGGIAATMGHGNRYGATGGHHSLDFDFTIVEEV